MVAASKVMEVVAERDNILHEPNLSLRQDQIGVAKTTFKDLHSVRNKRDKEENSLKHIMQLLKP